MLYFMLDFFDTNSRPLANANSKVLTGVHDRFAAGKVLYAGC